MLSHLPDDTSAQSTRSTGNDNPLLSLSVVFLDRPLAESVLFGEGCDCFRHCDYECIGKVGTEIWERYRIDHGVYIPR